MKKIILALGIVAPSLLFGQVDRSVVPSPGKAPVINIKDSEVFTAKNGMTVILSENHKLPTVRFSLYVGPGPELEGSKAGLSSIAGQLITTGTTNMSKDEIDSKIDYIGANLSASEGSISLGCLTKHMDKGLEVMADVLKNASFPQEEFDRVVKQSESGLMAAKSNPNEMANNAVMTVNFPNHPFGEVMTEATLGNITRDDVVSFYKKSFVPYKSYFVIVGDINREKAEQIISRYFGDWMGTKFIEPELNKGAFGKGNRVIFVKKPGAVQSVVTVTFPLDIKAGDEDQIPLTVLNGILGGGGFGNRLMQNLREDKAYTYGCYSSMDINEEGSYFTAGGNFRNDVTDSAITEILSELDKITNEYVKEDELNLTKSSMAGGFARSLERPSTIARFAFNIIRYELDKDYYQNYLKRLEGVSKDDVLAMAQKYLTAKNCNIVVVGNEEILDRLKQFDTDGQIELLDAFGQEVKEMKPADIAADELLCNYFKAVTKSATVKDGLKKIKKIKSIEQQIAFTMSQVPFPLKSTSVWVAPNSEARKLEAQGMVMQRSYFDGKSGFESNMQTGKSELTAEEIADKNKSTGLFPELNYKDSGMEYKLLGIENQNGKDFYVLELTQSKGQTFDYYDVNTFLKVKTYSITTDEEGNQQEVTTHINEYKEVNGLLFPGLINVSIGEMGLSGKVEEIKINSGSLKDYE